MGLLDKARDSQNNISSGLNTLYKTLNSIQPGVDFSAQLFRYLIDFLEIEKAALFFISEKPRSFECLLTKGYDKTTSNRLRLDENCSESGEFSFFNSERKAFHSAEAPLFLKDYMSSREFGLLEDIYWLPFFVDDEMIALIMISHWNGIIPDSWESIFQAVSMRYSKTIFDSRKSLVKSPVAVSGRVSRQDLEDLFKGLAGRNVVIVKIDLNPLILLLSRKDGLSNVNIKREILSVIRTMAGAQQEIRELLNNQLILILDKDRTPDRDLFLHQISASLPLLFQNLETAPDIQYSFYENPVDDASRDALLSELL